MLKGIFNICMSEAVVKLLQDKGLLIEDEGRKVMFAKPESSKVPLTVVKTDGSYTYDTSDMATLKQRIEEEKADRIIYVTDEGQSTHFKTIFSCGEIAEIWDRSKVRVDHATFGVVLGEDGKKFKTRSGDTVRLADLLLEGVRRAEEKLKEKGRDQELTAEELVAARDNVAIGCIKYNDLCHNRCHEYMFSFDKMLEDKGNTAAYLLYQYTRIKSISRLGGVNEEEVLQRAANEPLVLEHEKEIKLAKTLMKFPIVIERLLDDLLLHSLCEYLYEVSQTFSEFYDNCYCIERNRETKEVIKIHYNRLMMCEATARIMAACFNILGVKPVSRM
ncbi:unnamed protein product [Notodromas monacha]|uniref:arginine--tRNA ligase n=1 Tax=Notodromas monacha TaxID=399045 RepID=A0A7R9BN08_9CRUS|nr:unnamed protein product [Notodromas monacha]CAG0917413.1 unnamed protein product [Notodromas monacha]